MEEKHSQSSVAGEDMAAQFGLQRQAVGLGDVCIQVGTVYGCRFHGSRHAKGKILSPLICSDDSAGITPCVRGIVPRTIVDQGPVHELCARIIAVTVPVKIVGQAEFPDDDIQKLRSAEGNGFLSEGPHQFQFRRNIAHAIGFSVREPGNSSGTAHAFPPAELRIQFDLENVAQGRVEQKGRGERQGGRFIGRQAVRPLVGGFEPGVILPDKCLLKVHRHSMRSGRICGSFLRPGHAGCRDHKKCEADERTESHRVLTSSREW